MTFLYRVGRRFLLLCTKNIYIHKRSQWIPFLMRFSLVETRSLKILQQQYILSPDEKHVYKFYLEKHYYKVELILKKIVECGVRTCLGNGNDPRQSSTYNFF